MKPWAIVGTGPSAADVDDWGRLSRERRVVCINAAIEEIPFPDVLLLHDPKAADEYVQEVESPTLVVFTDLVDAVIPEVILKYSPHMLMRRTVGGSLPQAIRYLAKWRDVRDIELYGIDLEGPLYDNQVAALFAQIDEFNLNVRVCCPSSVLPRILEESANPCGKLKEDIISRVTVEGRPWTRTTVEVS